MGFSFPLSQEIYPQTMHENINKKESGMTDYDAIVIGAGCGGLSAGALLARQGRKVLLLEQSERVGGCCSTFERDGYRFDVGASIVEIIQPIERTFEKLGTSLQKEVDLIPCDPIMSVISRDGSRITYPLSVEATGKIISEISPEDGRRWGEFAAYMQEFMEVTLNTFFIEPADTLTDMLHMGQKDPRLLKFMPAFISSYQDIIERYFKHPKVLETMGYQAYYFGHPPALVPGPFAMVPYSEHSGVYYPRGGMIRIPEALQRCGEQFGLEVRLNTAVEKVLVRNRKVEGVELADGTQITSKLVISNINAKTLYLKMIGAEALPPLARAGIESYQYSISTPMIYLGVDYEPPLKSHHSFIAVTPQQLNDYYFNYQERGKFAPENYGLICWPSHSDDSLAPAGHHVLNLIPTAGYDLEGTDWDKEKAGYIERTLDELSRFAVPGLKEHVKVIECSTPMDFERRLRLPKGAIYALQQDTSAQAVFRPSARSKSIRGLYLTGSSTHPGGGVPTTIASGYIAANLIEKYEA